MISGWGVYLVNALVGANTILLSIVGFFLTRALNQASETSRAMISFSTKLEVHMEKLQYHREMLERHEATNDKEHERLRDDIEILSKRDHELGNMIHQVYGHASLHGWDIPTPQELSRRR